MKSKRLERSPAVPDFKLLFETIPGLFVVLTADDPKFTVVAVSDPYPRAVRKSRDEMGGRRLCEMFPAGPNPVSAATIRNIEASFRRVIETKAPDRLPIA